VTVEKQTLEALAFEKQTKNKDFDKKMRVSYQNLNARRFNFMCSCFRRSTQTKNLPKYGATFRKC